MTATAAPAPAAQARPQMPWPLAWHGHNATLHTRYGTDGPPEHQARCTCRWAGAEWWEPPYSYDPATGRNVLAASTIENAVAAGGVSVWRGERGQRYGTREDALAELLAHIGYEPTEHASQVAAAREALAAEIAAATGADPLADAAQIADLAEAYRHQQAQYDGLNQPAPNLTSKEK